MNETGRARAYNSSFLNEKTKRSGEGDSEQCLLFADFGNRFEAPDEERCLPLMIGQLRVPIESDD